MTRPGTDGLERALFSLLWAGLLAPVVAHGLCRPLGHLIRGGGDATVVTRSALALALVTGLAWRGGRGPRWFPVLVGAVAAAALSASLSLGPSGLGALLGAVGISAALFDRIPARLPQELDGLAGRHPRLTALYGLVALLSLVSTARVSTFLGDPTRVDHQVLPGEKFTEVHSCLSAYVRASALARRGVDDLYADPWWLGSLGLPDLPPGEENPFAPFLLDNFNYPPTFLLLTAPLAPLDGDFLAQRALWFGLNGLLAALGVWVLARWIGGPGSHRAVLLAPLMFGSLPVLLVLQIGNFHVAATVLSVLAMVALERRRGALGGALLASAILSKISPGLLGVVLLVQRRVRDAVLAAGFGVLLLGLTVLCYGTNPVRGFLTTALPHLSNGMAFPFMATDAGIATNMAPFGLPFKLPIIGLAVGDPWRWGPIVARLYTLALLALTLAGARRGGDRREQAIRWLALLVLGAMQSPFSPAYSTIGLMWATTLLSVEVRRTWQALALIALWPAILYVPPGAGLVTQSILSVAHTALTLAVSAWLALRAPRGTTVSIQSP